MDGGCRLAGGSHGWRNGSGYRWNETELEVSKVEDVLSFAPLATPQPRWKCFLAGWGMQTFALSALLAFNALFPHQVQQAKAHMVMHIVAPYEPPTIKEPQPVNLRVKVKPIPQPVTEPPVIAKLVPPPLPKAKEPEPVAPEIKVASPSPKVRPMPKAPQTNVIATNTFSQPTNVMPTTAKSASQVQTGGFGDPNGIAATGDGKHAANINAKGSWGVPMGAGFGNGTGGARGTAGVGIVTNTGKVQPSGFDNQAAAPVRKVEPEAATDATPVEIVSKPLPAYTEEGRKAKVEGEVRLEVLFSATGQAHVVRVLQGLGHGLDEQAVRAAEQIKFKPAKHAGQPVDSTAKVRMIFELAS
jgi:TonB family protein